MTRPRVRRAQRTIRHRSPIEKHRLKVIIDSDVFHGNVSALARHIQAGEKTVHALLRGQFRSIGHIEPKIAEALGVSPEYLGWPQDDTEVDPTDVPVRDRWYAMKPRGL